MNWLFALRLTVGSIVFVLAGSLCLIVAGGFLSFVFEHPGLIIAIPAAWCIGLMVTGYLFGYDWIKRLIPAPVSKTKSE